MVSQKIPHMRVPQLLCDQNRNSATRVDSKGISGSPEYKQLQGCWMERKTEDIRILETKKRQHAYRNAPIDPQGRIVQKYQFKGQYICPPNKYI